MIVITTSHYVDLISYMKKNNLSSADGHLEHITEPNKR